MNLPEECFAPLGCAPAWLHDYHRSYDNLLLTIGMETTGAI
jgi:hypothetical protein